MKGPRIYIRLGNAHYFCGDYKKALEYYNMALRGYPRHKVATYNESLTFFSLKNYEKSLKGLKKVLESIQMIKKQSIFLNSLNRWRGELVVRLCAGTTV